MLTPITHYALSWSPDNNIGGVALQLESGERLEILVKTPAELAGYAAILDEEPVYWDNDYQRITTDWEATWEFGERREGSTTRPH